MTNDFQLLVNTCVEKKITIATCESISAGLLASKIADIPGASQVLAFGLVTYQTAAKVQILEIADIIARHGVISQECANAMAKVTSEYNLSDISIAITGNAGPDVQDEKPVGFVYIAILFRGEIHEYPLTLSGSRHEIREKVCQIACTEMMNLIIGG